MQPEVLLLFKNFNFVLNPFVRNDTLLLEVICHTKKAEIYKFQQN
jgi:hypothetical protein